MGLKIRQLIEENQLDFLFQDSEILEEQQTERISFEVMDIKGELLEALRA